MDPTAPVGYNSQGDMTPFTRFNSQGDPIPFYTNARGDIVPYSFLHPGPDGSPALFFFDSNNNPIPLVGDVFGRSPVPQPLSAGSKTPPANLPSLADTLLLL